MMTEFEIDILKRVIKTTRRHSRHIDIDNILDISEARELTDNFRKNPDKYRGRESIPIRSFKIDIDEFWDDYLNSEANL